MKPAGLYIHIPFCLKKCDYCAFYSITNLDLMDEFVQALLQEIELYRGFGPFDTVYFGGGTPSLLTLGQLEAIIDRIFTAFSVIDGAEWTIEANPGDLNRSYCRGLMAAGFNRINIGVQSLDDSILSLLGRRHTRADALGAVDHARAAGFDNLGLDFIYGIPGQDLNDCLGDLRSLVAFSPEHLSCYQLTLEEGTPLTDRYRKGHYTETGEEAAAEYFMAISNILTAAGYLHYEVSNYARTPERQSRHNSKYWDHTPYLGLGPAAHSFDGRRRWWNSRSVEHYCRILKTTKPPVDEEETLTSEDLRLETLSLGLRTTRGISIKDYDRDYETDFLEENRIVLEHLFAEDLVLLEEGFLRPTRKGLAVADALARELA